MRLSLFFRFQIGHYIHLFQLGRPWWVYVQSELTFNVVNFDLELYTFLSGAFFNSENICFDVGLSRVIAAGLLLVYLTSNVISQINS